MIRTSIRPLSSLLNHPRNPKAHAIEDLIASIERFGFVEPVVVDDRTGLLVSGHGRVEALRRMEAAGKPPPDGVVLLSATDSEVPFVWGVEVVEGFRTESDEEALAFLVAANQLTALGGWDDVALARLLTPADTDLTGLGFTDRDVSRLAKAPPLPASLAGVKVVPPSVADLVEYIACPHCQHRFPA